jgi:hypothetical protein
MHTENNQQLTSIEVSQLADVTGGSLWSSAFKLAEKAAPLVKKAVPFITHTALPYVEHKAVQVAKWTGIPAAVGAGASWVKHELGK